MCAFRTQIRKTIHWDTREENNGWHQTLVNNGYDLNMSIYGLLSTQYIITPISFPLWAELYPGIKRF